MRHPLARAFGGAGLNAVDVAARLGVDPKTVARWLAGRTPYPRHQAMLANLTGWSVDQLWPDASRRAETDQASADLGAVYPHRSAIGLDLWRHVFARADHEIGVLVYSGLFLAEDVAVQRIWRDKARRGVRIRFVLGDPASTHVQQRGADEGIADVMAVRIRNALALLQPLVGEPGVDLRLHDTVLYNSIYLTDDDLIVNTHVYGRPASHAPVLHLRRGQDDGMTATYLDSFERVWSTARPVPLVD